MSIWLGVVLMLLTTAAMEGVAWLSHRYVMHGFLWSLHASHHRPRRGMFELNDWFAVIFATPSIALIYWGVNGAPAALWIGIGIALYGLIYFLVHDVLVHRRVPHGFTPLKGYLRRLHQAHHIHHAWHAKEGAVSFGFVIPGDPEKLAATLAKRREKAPAPHA